VEVYSEGIDNRPSTVNHPHRKPQRLENKVLQILAQVHGQSGKNGQNSAISEIGL
jgi:hypothetical protein